MGIKLEKTLFIILFLTLTGIAKSAEKVVEKQEETVVFLTYVSCIVIGKGYSAWSNTQTQG